MMTKRLGMRLLPCLWPCLWLLLTVAGRADDAGDAGDLRKQVDAFYATQAKRDIDAHAALWSPNAAGLAEHRKRLQELFDAHSEIQVKLVKVLRQKIERASAMLQAYSEMTATEKSGKPSSAFGKRVTNLQFAKESAGWKMQRASDAYRDLYDGLQAAKTRQERQTLLDLDRAVIGPDFVVSINLNAETAARESKLDDALRLNDIAYEVAAFLRDRSLGGVCFTSRGLIFAAAKKYDDAVQQYDRALLELRDAQDKVNEALTLNYLGITQLNMGKSAEATKSFEQSLAVVRSLNNKSVEGLVLSNLGATHERMENPAAALTAYAQSAAAYRAAADRNNESRTLVILGNLQRKQKKTKEALASYEAALKLRKDLGDRDGESDLLLGLGSLYAQDGDSKQANELFEAALAVVKELKNKPREAIALHNLGTTQEKLNNLSAAIAAYRASAGAYREAGDKPGEARALVALGNAQRLEKKNAEALAAYEAALALQREAKNAQAEADILMGIGAVQSQLGENGKAAQSFESALALIREQKDKKLEAVALSNLGALQEQLKNLPAAEKAHTEALALYRESKDEVGEARTLANLGGVQRAQKKTREALASYEAAIKLRGEFKDNKDRIAEANLMMIVGVLRNDLGETEKAAADFQSALTIIRAEKDKKLEAVSLANLGSLQEQMKQLPAALTSYETAAKLYREQGEKSSEARQLVNVGNVQNALKKTADAIAAYEAALKLRRELRPELKETAAEADLLIAIGSLVHQTDPKKAAAMFEAALKVVRAGDEKTDKKEQRRQEAGVLASLGAMHDRLNNNKEAIAAYEDSIKAYNEIGDKAGESRLLVNLGNLHNRSGKTKEAFDHYQRSLKLRLESQDRAGEADLQMGMGLIHYGRGETQKAIAAWEAGLQVARALGNRNLQAAALLNLGTAFEQTDSHIPALASYDEAQKLYKDLGDRSGEVRALVGLGNVQRGLRNQSAALNSFDEGLKLATQLQDVDNQFRCRLGRALILTGQSKWAEARAEYRHCLATLDALPLGLQVGPARALTVADRRSLRDSFALTALQLHNAGAKPEGEEAKLGATFAEIAFAETESRRAHTHVDLLEVLGVALKDGASAQLTARERELAQQVATHARALTALTSQSDGSVGQGDRDEKQIKETEDKLRDAEKQLKALVLSLRETKYGRLRYPETTTLADARRALPAGAALLDYQVFGEQTALYVVTRTTFSSTMLPLARAALAQRTNELLVKLNEGAKPGTANDLANLSAALYQALIAPVAAELKGVKRLIIIPDGPLAYLPFGALVSALDPKDKAPIYLIDEYAVSTAPSLGSLLAARDPKSKPKAPPARHLVAFAAPEVNVPQDNATNNDNAAGAGGDKPQSYGSVGKSPVPLTLDLAANEAQAAALIFKPKDKTFVGKEATEAQAKAEAGSARVLLLATPVQLSDTEIARLGIPFTKSGDGDGWLRVEELSNLKLNADLVLITGATTANGRLISGDGLSLLTRSLEYAGAGSVAISLWHVNDPARVRLTQSLLTTLRDQFAAATIDKAEALRQAQLKLRRIPATAHPYYWAALVLAGDWQ